MAFVLMTQKQEQLASRGERSVNPPSGGWGTPSVHFFLERHLGIFVLTTRTSPLPFPTTNCRFLNVQPITWNTSEERAPCSTRSMTAARGRPPPKPRPSSRTRSGRPSAARWSTSSCEGCAPAGGHPPQSPRDFSPKSIRPGHPL